MSVILIRIKIFNQGKILLLINFNMSDIKIQTIEKNFDHILTSVGNESFVNWEQFTHSSAAVINSIDELNKKMNMFRQCQHKNFIQTMKKLKSLDLPDLIGAVKGKKLPKEALRSVTSRFKAGEGDKIELVEPVENLKQNATKEFEEYVKKNNVFLQELKKYSNLIDERVKDFGFLPEEPVESPIKATVKFNLSEQLATKLADDIKVQYIPGTSYIGIKTYSQVVGSSYDLVKQENTKLTKDARVKQRQSKKDEAKYLNVMKQFLLNGQALVIEGQKLLAQKLGLSSGKFEESQVLMMERGLGNHLLMLQSQLRSKVKQSIPPTKQVSFELAKQVILFQTKMITQKQEYIKKVFDGLQKSQQAVESIPMLLALILNDMVYQKYGFEEQDFMKNVSEQVISTNPELTKIFKDMQLAIVRIMQYIGLIPAQVGRYMQQGIQQRGNPQQPQVGQQVPGMVPGMMPGMSNPMQMLQMQQMQQMQQMFAAQQKQP